MNIYVLFSLLLFLAPGGCPIYSIDLSTLEVPNDFQNELTLQSMLSSELHQYRNKLNFNAKINELSAAQHFEQAHPQSPEDLLERSEMMRSIEDRIKATYYAAASPDELDSDMEAAAEHQSSKVYRSASDEASFLGTNLFGNYPKKCFSAEDIALMSARKDFEMLVPKSYPQCLLHDGIVYTLMRYFNSVNQMIKRMSDVESRRLLQRAFYDALGGYLRFYLLPVAQVSYYAGRLKLCTVERLVALYRQCQLVLNTNGNGWRTPVADVLSQLKIVHIKPIKLNEEKGSENDASSCALLDQSCLNEDAQREQMIVPLPHLESEDSNGFLSNIFLPFKHRRIYNLRSPDASFILVKFFKTLINCYRFQGISPKTYNRKLRNWIRESLQLHYRDEIFYPGLGGVLQIYEALSCSTKSAIQSEENEEPEDDCKDYQSSPDDDINVADNGNKRNNNRTTERLHKNKMDKDDEASRKQSRSPRQKHDPGDASDQKDGEEGKNHNDTKEEECVECEDESYVAYIAAFLGLLLLLLLLIICCCLQRRKRRVVGNVLKSKPKPREKAHEKSSDKQEPDVEAPPPNHKSDEVNESCWSNLFRSRKKKHRKDRKKHDEVDNTAQPTPGMGFIGSQQGDSSPYPMKLANLEKFIPRKKGSTTEHNYEHDSMTSTSSLGYHFQRKFIPLKVGREKRDDYYPKTERKRSKPDNKQSSYVFKREREHDRERDREQRSQKPPAIPEEELPEKREKPPAKEDVVKQIHSHYKYKRQEGGLSSISHDRREVNFCASISSTNASTKSDCRSNSSSARGKESSEDKGHETYVKLTTETSSTFPSLTVPNPSNVSQSQPDNEEAASIPLSSPAESKAAGETSMYAASWETFEEDCK
ncbi:hypothetical protein ACLKA7_009739 [Drosophila subpalustris]